eukprot:COSAG04_NODE_23040_length_345_cov_0.617886_1_plen_101_part_10
MSRKLWTYMSVRYTPLHSGQGRECLPGHPWPLKGGWVMRTGYGWRRGDADHLAGPQAAQVAKNPVALVTRQHRHNCVAVHLEVEALPRGHGWEGGRLLLIG